MYTKKRQPSDCSLGSSATSSEGGAAIDDKELPEFHCDDADEKLLLIEAVEKIGHRKLASTITYSQSYN
ncbi:hypothetical protein RO3G_09395 [Rhizopus delemar RA 99-880]|uniref:Uncharacterized protein n=1 Tax=Rhizopus delemar (strain RA 99-880 / ATCC MYA-4621 / FGSC 9543 / NRRL 43880) TaxID=246409 RepID=I1C8A5_RHIO9|nr:hypothetical protein RO3G_09395 [Rhizopus delemar RA 99-880]|eukprot:EIE84685.1 hypothetical protein RO3G_09395 [Rhizopus delemar RA 99-880]